MLRRDGTYEFYVVQHWGTGGSGPERWVNSALDHLLFGKLTFAEKNGPKGDNYRKFLEPQNASSDLWQRTGEHGFEKIEDAVMAMALCLHENPTVKFRVVRVNITQITTEMFKLSERS